MKNSGIKNDKDLVFISETPQYSRKHPGIPYHDGKSFSIWAIKRYSFFFCVAIGGLLALLLTAPFRFAFAEEGKSKEKLTKRGADSCIKCHDENNEYPVMPLFKTKHAQSGDPRSPFAGLQCESCHGAGAAHAETKVKGDEKRPPIISFGRDKQTPVVKQNSQCLQCHENHDRIGWQGSVHEFNEVACADCHSIHTARDPVLDGLEQPQVCYTCHQRQRAQFFQASVHPVRQGRMTCSHCHQTHGGLQAGLATDRALLRETCASCHAEKRGPFLWEHAPAAEECTLCHQPHGSSQPTLLKKRPPFLCQQCHSQAGHPSVQYDGTVRNQTPSRFVAVKGCLKCHYQIHGSNHPSGVKLMR